MRFINGIVPRKLKFCFTVFRTLEIADLIFDNQTFYLKLPLHSREWGRDMFVFFIN